MPPTPGRHPSCFAPPAADARDRLSVPDAATARTLDREKSPWFQLLNGQWNFKMVDRPELLKEADVAVETDREDWDNVAVPGNWTLQGYGAPHYTNVQMPFADEPPSVPKENPTGVYVREVRIPRDWKGRRVVIHFGGAESVLFLYVNGKTVGFGKDCRLPSEFDITDFVKIGRTNTVAAVVVKWSDATFIEDQDQWWMGGLHREVYLYSTDPVYIADVFAKGKLDEEYEDGLLDVTVRAGFPGSPRWAGRSPCSSLMRRARRFLRRQSRRRLQRRGLPPALSIASWRSYPFRSENRSSGRRRFPIFTQSSLLSSALRAKRSKRPPRESASALSRCATASCWSMASASSFTA